MDLLQKMKDIEIKIDKLNTQLEHNTYNVLAGYSDYEIFKSNEKKINEQISKLKEKLIELEKQYKEISIKQIREMGGLL